MLARVLSLAALLAGARASAAVITVGPYVQDVRPDGFTVAFDTDVETDAVVMVGERRVASAGTRHEARVDGLAASTRYRYAITIDGAERASASVTTAPDGPRPFTFIVYGDTRDGPEIERAIAEAALAEAPELAIHTGDLVHLGGDAPAWPAFFNAERALLAEVPIYPAAGNHELYGDASGAEFRRWFVLPDGGREARHYAFAWGQARFIVLDGNATGDDHTRETAWLERALDDARSFRHIFVVLHQPPLSMGGHCGAGPADADWLALFERHRVRAVFAGHDHAYQRLERNGVRYFITGGGGAPVYAEHDCPAYDRDARRVYSAEHHFLRVRVSGERVEVVALRLGGPPIETVRFDDRPLVALGPAPPLDGSAPSGPRRWPLAAGGIALLAVLGGLLRRRRPR